MDAEESRGWWQRTCPLTVGWSPVIFKSCQQAERAEDCSSGPSTIWLRGVQRWLQCGQLKSRDLEGIGRRQPLLTLAAIITLLWPQSELGNKWAERLQDRMLHCKVWVFCECELFSERIFTHWNPAQQLQRRQQGEIKSGVGRKMQQSWGKIVTVQCERWKGEHQQKRVVEQLWKWPRELGRELCPECLKEKFRNLIAWEEGSCLEGWGRSDIGRGGPSATSIGIQMTKWERFFTGSWWWLS